MLKKDLDPESIEFGGKAPLKLRKKRVFVFSKYCFFILKKKLTKKNKMIIVTGTILFHSTEEQEIDINLESNCKKIRSFIGIKKEYI